MGDWSKFDTDMVLLAQSRGQVWYLAKSDQEIKVTLVAWRGRLGRTRCRIRHYHGAEATVGTHLVRPIPVDVTPVG